MTDNTIRINKGFSLVEVILAVALFGMFATALLGLLMNSYGSDVQARQKDLATLYAQEGMEAVWSIRRQSWNFLNNGTFGLDNSAGYWQFLEEADLLDGRYTRTIIIADACRDGGSNLVDCLTPGATVDLYAKKVISKVDYASINGIANSVELSAYLTAWQSVDWIQTDWSGGSGQSIWVEQTKYDNDDNNLDIGTSGQISLASIAGNGCGVKIWPFTVPGDYVYDADDIEVTGGVAQLVGDVPADWWNSSYSYRRHLTVSVGSNPPQNRYNGYTVRISNWDTANLINSGKMKNDCSDLRIVYNHEGFNELDRQVINCNTSATDVRFRLARDINNSSSDNNYYVYYGFAAASAPPQNLANVYLWYDDAVTDRSSSYLFGRCDNWHGSGYRAWSYNAANDWYQVDTGDNRTSCLRYPANERDAYIEAEFYHSNCYSSNMSSGVIARYVRASGTGSSESASHYYASNRAQQSSCGSGYNHDGDICEGNRCDLGVNGTNPAAIVINQWRKQALAVWGTNNTNLKFWDANTVFGFGSLGWPTATPNASGVDSSDQESSGDWGVIVAQDYARVRNILIRRYTEPEPTLSLDLEEASGGSYAATNPNVNPLNLHRPDKMDAWTSFTEIANKAGGEIYYQLSDDGNRWFYWNGSDWGLAGAGNYNLASVINDNIGTFPTSSGAISFKAFLASDGTQQVQLDEVKISCAQYYDWPFDATTDYIYNPAEIEISGGSAQLVTAASGSGATLDSGFNFGLATNYHWPFDAATDYVYNPAEIEVYNGLAGLKISGGTNYSGQTVNSTFDLDAAGWSYNDWGQNAGESDVYGNMMVNGGNPNGWAYINFPWGRNDEFGGYGIQAFVTTVDNPQAVLSFDWRISDFNFSPDTFKVYVFIDNHPGEPLIGQEVWSSGEVSGETGWASVNDIDVSDKLVAAGTYYLKIAAWVESGGGLGDGPFEVGFDNVLLSWNKILGGSYSVINPDLRPVSFYPTEGVSNWIGFTESANKAGGEIYYQLSDNNTDWYYWDNDQWSVASQDDYNTAEVISSQIASFPVNDGITFKAFLSSDGTQPVQLDAVDINFSSVPPVWNFATWAVGSGEVTPTGSLQSAGGNPDRWADIYIPTSFFDQVGGYWEQTFTTTIDNPSLGEINFDYKVFDYNGFALATQIRVYLDSNSGPPTNQIGSAVIVNGVTDWTSAPSIDAKEIIKTAGTYYLKIAFWLDGFILSGPYQIGLDNVRLDWSGISYAESKPSITPFEIYDVAGLNSWTFFTESANKAGGEIYYQLSDNNTDWYYWDNDQWSVASQDDYNTAVVVNNNINQFATSSGAISFKAFLVSDGTQQVQLNNVRIGWGEDFGSGGYQDFGYLMSSAFDLGSRAGLGVIEWDQNISECEPNCEIKLQVRTAPDGSGGPGAWSDWYGASGSGSYFTNADGTILPAILNFNRWLQYRVELIGDGTQTPILEQVKINYLP
ncbi:MAG: prepilin-type N-terminal cleavage/methylation domain-containing protein [Patescibacteria group bacterium]|jgi:prepilin-type N-terminal cleavage/methylation domain-containing protein|nr:prepilin-type N-terminal cleavage/methylation domain-containing protein [Patescibacteria group bacterium]